MNKIISVLIILLIIFLMIVQGASATTYYVAKTGNDGNVGSEISPWLTINKSAQTMVAGDTAYVKAGTYTEVIRAANSGNVNSYITFQNYSGHIVVIQAPNQSGIYHGWDTVTPSHHSGNWEILGKSYIKIKGFNFTSPAGTVMSFSQQPDGSFSVEQNSHDIIIDGNTFYKNAFYTAIRAGYFGSSSYYAWNITFINNYINFSSSGGSDQGAKEALSFDHVNNANVSYNRLYGMDGIAIDLKNGGSNSIVSYNDIRNVKWTDPSNSWTGYLGPGIYIDGSYYGMTNVSVFNNIVVDADYIGVGSECGGLVENVTFYNNILVRGYQGYTLPDYYYCGGAANYKDIKFINNVNYNSVNSFRVQKDADVIISNNLVYLNDYHEIHSGNIESNNSWDMGITNPFFVDVANYDFHLQSNSPAIDVGSSVNSPSFDFENNVRPFGPKWDIGVYEYGSLPPVSKRAPIRIGYGNSKSNDHSLSITLNTSESVTFNFTADQIVTGVWTNTDGRTSGIETTSYSTAWVSPGIKSVTGMGINSNGSIVTTTWTIQVQPIEDNPSRIGLSGASWSGHSTMDNLYSDNQRIRPGIYRDDFDDGTHDFSGGWGNVSVVGGKLQTYGTYASLYKNIDNHTDIALFLQINETNTTAMQILGIRSDTSRSALEQAYKAVLVSNGTAQLQVKDESYVTTIINSSVYTRTANVESSYVLKTCSNTLKLYASNTSSYASALNNLISTGSNNLYSYGNKIYMQTNVYDSTQSNTLDNIRVLKTDASCNILHSGNLTAHYDAGVNNVTNIIIVNTSFDSDYTLEYRQYLTNNTWISLGTNLSGNQTKNTIYGSKYQQTEVRITSYFNDTSSPEIRTTEFITEEVAATNVYPRYDVDENGTVDMDDLTIVGQHFNEIVSIPYPRYDVNMDGLVNIDDITIVGQHFGEKI